MGEQEEKPTGKGGKIMRLNMHDLAHACKVQHKKAADKKSVCLTCPVIEECGQYARYMSQICPEFWLGREEVLLYDVIFSESDYTRGEKYE